MISTKSAAAIICEIDKDKRNKMIDKLSEEDAKYILKQYLTVHRERTGFDFKFEFK